MEKQPNPVEMMDIKVRLPRRTVEAIDAMAAQHAGNRQAEAARVLVAYGDGEIKNGYTLTPYDHGNAKNGNRP